jgi:hypothetical protein
MDTGTCEHCQKSFPYRLIHNGFNDSAYAYCDTCGVVTMLDGWKLPKGITFEIYQVIPPEIEPLLSPCECGGHFRKGASPRCPHCQKELSPIHAGNWIERDAPGTKKGWRWQNGWTGTYCIWINDHHFSDNWKTEEEQPTSASNTTARKPRRG